MRTLWRGDSRGRISGLQKGKARRVSLAGSSAPIRNSPAGIRTSVIPSEFVSVGGACRGGTSGAPDAVHDTAPSVMAARIDARDESVLPVIDDLSDGDWI